VILFAEGKLKGLTTATSIWVAAALGMAIGLGQYFLSLVATVLVVVVLELFSPLDSWLDAKGRETLTYQITYIDRPGKGEQLEQVFHKYRLVIRRHQPMRQGGLRCDRWEIDGRAGDHLAMAEELLSDAEVKGLQY
jgi:putative Mg2+ transporter-C (MgtC) family protein